MRWVPDFDLSQDWIAFVIWMGGATVAVFPPDTLLYKTLWILFCTVFGLVIIYINSENRKQKKILEDRELESRIEIEENKVRLQELEKKKDIEHELLMLSIDLSRFIDEEAFEPNYEKSADRYKNEFRRRVMKIPHNLKKIHIYDMPFANVLLYPSSLEIVRDIQQTLEKVLNAHFRGKTV